MEPITRKEKFLAAAGGQDVDLPTPVTREEVFLKAIADGGGGGGSDLPDVTAADNGKVLRVVSGEWNKADGDVFVCTFSQAQTYGTITCDKTIAEIASAYEAGKAVIGIAKYTMVQGSRAAGTAILNLVNVQYLDPSTLSTPNYVEFSAVTYAYDDVGNVHYYEVFRISGNLIMTANIWTANMNNIPMPTSSDNGKTYKVVNGELALVDMSPLIVTYTIVSPDSPYVLTVDHTLAEIASAYEAGKEILARITINGTVFTTPYTVQTASSGLVMATVNIFDVNSFAVLNGTIIHHLEDDVDDAVAFITPINTTTMTFDSTTNTLAITD